MLKFLRKNARSWVMYIILGIIIFVFVLYFGASRDGKGSQAIAIIDDRVITEGEFHDEYRKAQDMARLRYGSNLTPEILKKMDLKRIAYDGLLNKQIIIAKTADLKIKISDEELRSMIMSTSALQTDGIFDERKYQQLLRYYKTSAEDYEAMQKVNLAASKIDFLIRDGVKVSDQEIMDIYTMQNQKVNVKFIQIGPKDVKTKISPTDIELEKYLKENSNLFRIAEQVKVKYLYFPGDSFAPGTVSDSDIKDFYNRNTDRYRTKDGKQKQLADVKNEIIKEIKKAKGMQNAFSEAKKSHDIIYQEDNFDSYATKNRLSINALDFFPLNKAPQQFSSIKDFAPSLIDLGKNDISKVLTADNGYYLVRIIDKKAAYTPQLKDIRSNVEKRYMDSQIENIAVKEANLILERLHKGESLDKVAAEKGLKIYETGLFQPKNDNPIPKLGVNPEAVDTVIQLSAGSRYPERPILINNSYVIFEFKDHSKVDLTDFATKKDLYKKILSSVKREEAMQSWLAGNKEAMKKEGRIKIKKELKDL
jgi:peptidyl-prolyl cis-trans isomerase D